jgi:hypothetical protein
MEDYFGALKYGIKYIDCLLQHADSHPKPIQDVMEKNIIQNIESMQREMVETSPVEKNFSQDDKIILSKVMIDGFKLKLKNNTKKFDLNIKDPNKVLSNLENQSTADERNWRSKKIIKKFKEIFDNGNPLDVESLMFEIQKVFLYSMESYGKK